jgi:hypothetical protein
MLRLLLLAGRFHSVYRYVDKKNTFDLRVHSPLTVTYDLKQHPNKAFVFGDPV